MKTAAAVVVVLVLGLTGCSTFDVYVDYDRQADFKSVKTFAWMQHEGPNVRDANPLMDSRIKNAIEHYLAEAGLVENPDDPDILVTYFASTDDKVVLNTTSYGMGYGPGWGWSPYWGGGYSTTTASTYTEGTLIIDIWDARAKQVIWRGTASGVLAGNPQKVSEQVQYAVDQIVKKWRNEYRQGAR